MFTCLHVALGIISSTFGTWDARHQQRTQIAQWMNYIISVVIITIKIVVVSIDVGIIIHCCCDQLLLQLFNTTAVIILIIL